VVTLVPLYGRKKVKTPSINKSAWQFKKAQHPSSNLRARSVEIKMLKRVKTLHQLQEKRSSDTENCESPLCAARFAKYIYSVFKSKFVCAPVGARRRRPRTFTPCGHTLTKYISRCLHNAACGRQNKRAPHVHVKLQCPHIQYYVVCVKCVNTKP
jgi:hypothetical protein